MIVFYTQIADDFARLSAFAVWAGAFLCVN